MGQKWFNEICNNKRNGVWNNIPIFNRNLAKGQSFWERLEKKHQQHKKPKKNLNRIKHHEYEYNLKCKDVNLWWFSIIFFISWSIYDLISKLVWNIYLYLFVFFLSLLLLEIYRWATNTTN